MHSLPFQTTMKMYSDHLYADLCLHFFQYILIIPQIGALKYKIFEMSVEDARRVLVLYKSE